MQIQQRSRAFMTSLETLDQLEESRSSFLPNCYLKLEKHLKEYAQTMSDHFLKMEGMISDVTKSTHPKKESSMYLNMLHILNPIEKINLEHSIPDMYCCE